MCGGSLRGPTVFYCNASILFQKQIVGHVTRINQSGNFAQISRGVGGQKSFNRTDPKCLLCKKVVSSRQSALKHMGIYHPSENISENITKIQSNDGSKRVISKKTSNKRAVSFSSTLSKMFDNDCWFESIPEKNSSRIDDGQRSLGECTLEASEQRTIPEEEDSHNDFMDDNRSNRQINKFQTPFIVH